MKKKKLLFLLSVFLMLLQAKAWATKEDTLNTKYFQGFVAEKQMQSTLQPVLQQKILTLHDTAQLNIGLHWANLAIDSLKAEKKNIASVKIAINDYNTKYLEQLKSQNVAMIQVSRKIISTSNSTSKKLIAQRSKNKQIRKSNDKSVDDFLSGLKYYDTKYSENSKPEDTLKIFKTIELMNDSAKIYTDEYLLIAKNFTSTFDSIIQRLDSYKNFTQKGNKHLNKIAELRNLNNNDSDNYLSSEKKAWQMKQSATNSLLFLQHQFLTDTLLLQFKSLQQQHLKVIAIQKKVLKQNKKLRRYKHESQDLIQNYLSVSSEMQTFLYRHNDLIRKFSNNCNKLKKELKGVVKISTVENKNLNQELVIAKRNKGIRSKLIAILSSAKTKIVNTHLSNCLKNIKAVQRAKTKIYR